MINRVPEDRIPTWHQMALPFEGRPQWEGTCIICYGGATIISAPFPEGYCHQCFENGNVEDSIRHRVRWNEYSLDPADPNTPQHVKYLISEGIFGDKMPMTELVDYSFSMILRGGQKNDTWALGGRVFLHPKFEPGERIHVSRPVAYDVESGILTTISGSKYLLDGPDGDKEEIDKEIFEVIAKGGYSRH